MADTVETYTIFPEQKVGTSSNKSKRQIMRFTSRSDGTGESNVVKVSLAGLTGPTGAAPSKLAIDKIVYDVQGMEVLVSFDHTSDINIARLSGSGFEIDLYKQGGLTDTGTGGTGDLLFSTNAASSGDTYDITIHFRKKN